MSLVVVRHPRNGLTYGSVRPVSSVPGPMTATGLTGRRGSFFHTFLSALGAFSLFDAAGLTVRLRPHLDACAGRVVVLLLLFLRVSSWDSPCSSGCSRGRWATKRTCASVDELWRGWCEFLGWRLFTGVGKSVRARVGQGVRVALRASDPSVWYLALTKALVSRPWEKHTVLVPLVLPRSCSRMLGPELCSSEECTSILSVLGTLRHVERGTLFA